MGANSLTALTTLTALTALRAEHAAVAARGLSLDLTRGKPSRDQLDLSAPMLSLPGPDDYLAADGTDTRNYGGLVGIRELREMFAELLAVHVGQLLAMGNASLTLMHDTLAYAHLWGMPGSAGPWAALAGRKFICPTPGYDRHFTLCEAFGIEMIPVPNLPDSGGVDVEAVAALVADDPAIVGMWVVPTYANPDGSVLSEAAARRLASMPTAAPDFRIFWDNAYALHHLGAERPTANILALSADAGHPDRPILFASTSKITFPGAGVAFLAASPANIDWYTAHLSAQAIGPDKINQLRHVRFFRDADGVRAHMRRHRDVLAPRFAAVDRALNNRFEASSLDVTWTRPEGGYFISLDVVPGTARRVVELAAEAGVALTPAGATHPHGRDPLDRNLRIAPSMPSLSDVEVAAEVVALCVELAAVEAGALAP